MRTIVKSTETLAESVKSVLTEGPLVLTRRGKPLAAVIPVPGKMDLERLSLSTNPDFLDLLERSRRSYREHGGFGNEEVRRHLAELDRAEASETPHLDRE